MKSHAQLRKEVQKWFEARGAYVVPYNSWGYGRRGVADLLVCWKGRFWGVEVKVGADKVRPWQDKEAAKLAGAGGVAWVIHDDGEKLWLGVNLQGAVTRVALPHLDGLGEYLQC